MAAVDVFREEVARGDDARLDRLVLALAGTFDPLVDVDAEVARLDRLAERFGGGTPLDLLVWMHRAGYRGNTDDYYNPDNSMLHRVVRTRVGIPITLCVVAIEIGRRHGLRLQGVGAPGEFLYRGEDDRWLYNPFRGRTVDAVNLRELLSMQALPPGLTAEDLLAPVGPILVVERMLNNLEQIYERRRALVALERVYRLRSELPDAAPSVRRRWAAILEECGGVGLGLAQIRAVIDQRDPSEDVLAVRRDWLLRRRLEAHLN